MGGLEGSYGSYKTNKEIVMDIDEGFYGTCGSMYNDTITEEKIHDRKNTHGDADIQFTCSQEFKKLVRKWNKRRKKWGQEKLDPVRLEALEMNCLKMSRILCGDPYFVDHWEDIMGYSGRAIGK